MKPSFVRQFVLSAVLLLGAAHAWCAPSAFSVVVSGHGKPMILIPGLASSGEVWDDTVTHFKGQYEFHVLTLSGFAGNAPIEDDLLTKAEAELADYIVAKKMDHPIVVGHSLGGFLGMRLAADFPDRVGKLVIVDSLPALGATQIPTITAAQLRDMAAQMRNASLAQDATTYAASTRAFVSSMVTKPEHLERILAWGAKSDRVTVANAMYDLTSTDLRQDIARIKAPTLVLGTWIAYKDYVPRSAIEATFLSQYQKLPSVTVMLAENARHFIMYDDPQWMYTRMKQFLK